MPITKYLNYWRASVADAMIKAPKDEKVEQAVEILNWDIFSGRVPETATSTLWDRWQKSKRSKDDRKQQLVPIMIITMLLARQVADGVRFFGGRNSYPVILIRAHMDKNGRIVMQEGARPVIARDFLEPTRYDLVVAQMDAVDAFYARRSDKYTDWSEAVKFAFELEALAKDWDESFYVRKPGVYVMVSDEQVNTKSILNLYDWMISKSSQPEILARLLSDTPPLSELPSSADPRLAAMHVGQMGGEYGLSESQRDAVTAFLADAHPLLAINGPPGTGKTTLLQSIVATSWVRAAIEGADCPLIVATSTNNQAVENIIEAFERARSRADDELATLIGGRWIPDVRSYGMSMPSSKRESQSGKNFQKYERKPKGGDPGANFASGSLERTKWQAAASAFVTAFERCVPTLLKAAPIGIGEQIQQIRDHLQRLVRQQADEVFVILRIAAILRVGSGEVSVPSAKAAVTRWRVAAEEKQMTAQRHRALAMAIKKLANSWLAHRSREPFLTYLLASVGLKGRRIARDRAFLADLADEYDLPQLATIGEPQEHEVRIVVEEAARKRDEQAASLEASAEEDCKNAEDMEQAISTWLGYGMPDTMGMEDLAMALDTGRRHYAFLWATHYWEARFLLATKDVIDGEVVENTNPEKLAAHYRRLAMLAPCFVSSLHMIPSWFFGFNNGEPKPLLGEIDLLIIDEAGQVLPEIAASSIAIAKRALIVGDTHQLEPVWNVANATDQANAIRHGIVSDSAGYEALEKSTGRLAANGTIMVMAQQASRVASFPECERGIFLREHRRCRAEIIDYCNRLVYKGRLLPMTDETKRPKLKGLPVMGYAHILGFERKAGTSRANDIEAAVIAKWIAAKAEDIRRVYGNKPLGELLGVVTPFAAQASAIKRYLRREGLASQNITVGTVHALQGAEREIVIFSPTYGIHPKGLMFFDQGQNMLNVVVSRAKDHFLVFGNAELFSGSVSKPSGLLGSILFSSPDNEILDVAPAVPVDSNVTLVASLDEHRRHLVDVLRRARHTVGIVSPYLRREALDSDQISSLIEKAVKRGVRVLIATDEAFNKNYRDEFTQCVEALTTAGAKVLVAKPSERGFARLHSKLLWADTSVFVTGSFNWLSAARYEAGQKVEHSAAISGEAECRAMVRIVKDSVGAVVPGWAEVMEKIVPAA